MLTMLINIIGVLLIFIIEKLCRPISLVWYFQVIGNSLYSVGKQSIQVMLLYYDVQAIKVIDDYIHRFKYTITHRTI